MPCSSYFSIKNLWAILCSIDSVNPLIGYTDTRVAGIFSFLDIFSIPPISLDTVDSFVASNAALMADFGFSPEHRIKSTSYVFFQK